MTKIRLSETLLTQFTGQIAIRDKLAMTETRGNHAISAGLNFLRFIKENFSPEESEELTKRFVNAIRTNSPEKFYRGINHLKENIEE